MKKLTLSFLLLQQLSSFAQTQVPGFDNHTDIGKPKLAGSVSYDPERQIITLKGAGSNVWFNKDEASYLPTKIAGDFVLTTNVKFTDTTGNAHKKAGWMVRPSTDEYAPHVSALVHKDGLTSMQSRPLRGSFMRDPEDEIRDKKKHASVLQLERMGKTFIMRTAHDGEP
ncbi:MAG: hypothetical protein EOO02_05800, partial [Chitinophagaceae bacterium]